MTDQKQDIAFPSATSQILALALVNVDGSAFNLTGYTTIRCRIAPFPSGDAVIQYTQAAGIGVVGAPNLGTITVTIGNTDLPVAGLFVYDVVATIAGVDTRCKYGRIVVGITAAAPGA
jgi:hypothetical protein